jgi:hypothetical protein
LQFEARISKKTSSALFCLILLMQMRVLVFGGRQQLPLLQFECQQPLFRIQLKSGFCCLCRQWWILHCHAATTTNYSSSIHRASDIYSSSIHRASDIYSSSIHRASDIYSSSIHRTSDIYSHSSISLKFFFVSFRHASEFRATRM